MQSKLTQLNSDPDNEKERSLRKISSSIKFASHTNIYWWKKLYKKKYIYIYIYVYIYIYIYVYLYM